MARQDSIVSGSRLRPSLAPGSCRPPRLLPQVIPREPLVKRLLDVDGGLLSVRAPAGYGKTTTLALWRKADPRPFAWASLDHTDDDPARLLAHLTRAIGETVEVPDAVWRMVSEPGRSPLDDGLPALLEAMCALPPAVLVLDDVHLVTSAGSSACLQSLADHLPDGWVLALLGRTTGGLRLARHRLDGTLVELDAEGLAMSFDEARQLLDAMDVTIDADRLGELVDRTEGWPGGLHLAALRLRHAPRSEAVTLSGRDRLVADYLVDEVLIGLIPAQVTFLESSAVLDRMDGASLDELLDRTGSEQELHDLEDAGHLLLVPLDDERRWYRYHHLFGELLRSRLRRHDPDRYVALQRRASLLQELAGDIAAAATHAVAGGEPDRAAALVLSRADTLVLSGRPHELAMWLDRLGPEAPRTSVDAALAAAWLGVGVADLELISRATGTALALAGDRDEVCCAVATLEAIAGIGGLAGILARTEWAAEQAGGGEGRWWGLAMAVRGTALSMVGRAAEARQALANGRPLVADLPAVAAALEAHLALLDLYEGDLRAARGHMERVHAIQRLHDMEGLPLAMVTFAAGALVAASSHDPAGATRQAAIARPLVDKLDGTVPRSALLGHILLGRTALMTDDLDDARRHARLAVVARREEPLAVQLNAQLADLRRGLEVTATTRPGAPRLTPAERRLLPHLATHRSLREIADELVVSRNTAKSHAVAIYRKLGATSRTEAVANARRCGLLDG